ncbi:MAG: hypothetical protein QOG04_349 [Actinomycetota bacterium]|nr:hypothetical protein [Actinomycetota bacterium]
MLGLLPYSSNYTFLARVRTEGAEALAVYKPRRGERPLWDFPPGSLAARECAAFLVSEAAGWDLVPVTVLREDAPMGEGSFQLFVEHDPETHYFTLMHDRLDEFAAFAAFDAVINNADRKSGHVLEDGTGKLWAVDHGLTFHTEDKLRTVIWEFADEPLTKPVRNALEKLGAALSEGSLSGELSALLSDTEASATLARVEALLVDDCFPAPGTDRPLPWPLI